MSRISQPRIENLLWKVLTGDKLRSDETASTMFPGRTHHKHRFSHADCTTSNVSRGFAHLRSLRDDEHRSMSPLPYGHGGINFSFRIVMLRESIGMLRTLFYESDTILYKHALNRNDWHCRRARNDAHSASTSSAAAYLVLLNVGSARVKFVAEFLNETQEEDLMKYLLLIATFTAFIGTATATSPLADCCQGNGKCCHSKCCKK